MAWAEPLKSGRYRGGYRRPGDPDKHYVDGTFRLKRDAKDAAAEAEVAAKREAATRKGTLAASVRWGDWWDTISADRSPLADTSTVERSLVERYIRPRWGKTPLNGIEDVQEWMDRFAAGRDPNWVHQRQPSPAYAQRVFGLFRASINVAIKKKILTSSPCAGVELPPVRKRKDKPYLPVDDASKLKLRADYRDAVDFALETGLRPGELCGLHVHRINRKRRILTVADVLVEGRRLIRPYPKDDDMRRVPLSQKAMEILDRRIEGRDLTAGCGLPHVDEECPSALVFVTDLGRPMLPGGLRSAMYRASAKAKLPKRGGYTLRRGFVTRALDGGADPIAVQRITGHADLDELAGYAQDSPEARARLLAALGERVPLAPVEQHGTDSGARGTDRGTEPDRDTSAGTGIEGAEGAG